MIITRGIAKAHQITSKIEIGIVVIICTLFTIASITVSLTRHYSFDSQWYDFGIFDESIWKFSQFQNPIIPTKNFTHIWGDHFNPSALSLAPLYWMFPHQSLPFIAQAIAISLSGVVMWLLGRKLLIPPLFRIAILFAFYFFVGTQNAIYTDVHNMTFAALALTFVLYFAKENNSNLAYWVSLAWFLGWQENAAGIALGIGIWLMVSPKTRQRGIFTAIISLIWGLSVMKVVIPYFNQNNYAYQPHIPESFSGAVAQLFQPTIKSETMFFSLASFGFLPLLYPPLWPAILEQYIERFVLNQAGTRWDLGMHYNAILAPLFAMSSYAIVNRLRIFKQSWITFMTAGGIVFLSLLIGIFLKPGPLLLSYRHEFLSQPQKNAHYQSFLNHIPTDKGLIMTNNNLAAQLARKNVVLLFEKYQQYDPQVIAIYSRDGQNANNFFPLGPEKSLELISNLRTDPQYTITYEHPDGIIFQKTSR